MESLYLCLTIHMYLVLITHVSSQKYVDECFIITRKEEVTCHVCMFSHVMYELKNVYRTATVVSSNKQRMSYNIKTATVKHYKLKYKLE